MEFTIKFPPEAYARAREMILAGGKHPATGENGLHSASQLLLFMDQQVQQQQRQPPVENKLDEVKPNGRAKPELAESAVKT